MHAIESVVARAGCADHRVHVGTVAKNLCPDRVNQFADLANVLLEKAERRRIGHHERSNRVIQHRAKRFQVAIAVARGRHRLHVVATNRRARGVGSVRRIGNQNDLSLGPFATAFVVCANQHQAGQFAMRARDRLQTHRLEPGNLFQNVRDFSKEL